MSAFRVTLGVAVLAAAGLPSIVANAQSATTKTVAEVGGWTIVAVSVDGAHMRCATRPPGAASVSLEKSTEGWTVVVPTAASGDEPKGTVDVDGTASSATFYRMDDGRVGTFLQPAQVKRIGAGKRLTVTIAGTATAVALDGAAAAVKRTAACDADGGK